MSKGQYPEHEKQALIIKEAQAVGIFLDWLVDVHGVEFPKRIPELLENYYEIDPIQLEKEKRHMLKVCQRMNVLSDIDEKGELK